MTLKVDTEPRSHDARRAAKRLALGILAGASVVSLARANRGLPYLLQTALVDVAADKIRSKADTYSRKLGMAIYGRLYFHLLLVAGGGFLCFAAFGFMAKRGFPEYQAASITGGVLTAAALALRVVMRRGRSRQQAW